MHACLKNTLRMYASCLHASMLHTCMLGCVVHACTPPARVAQSLTSVPLHQSAITVCLAWRFFHTPDGDCLPAASVLYTYTSSIECVYFFFAFSFAVIADLISMGPLCEEIQCWVSWSALLYLLKRWLTAACGLLSAEVR